MEGRMSRLEGACEQMSARLDSMDAHLRAIDAKLDSKFNLLVGLIASSWVTIFVAVIAILVRR